MTTNLVAWLVVTARDNQSSHSLMMTSCLPAQVDGIILSEEGDGVTLSSSPPGAACGGGGEDSHVLGNDG